MRSPLNLRTLTLCVGLLGYVLLGLGLPVWAADADEIRRVKMQHHLDYDVPLADASFFGTHNSYSSTGEGYSIWVNQNATITQ